MLDSFLQKNPIVVVPGKMFGYPAYYGNKKLFPCVYEQGVGVKVPFEAADELIGKEGVIPFFPMGRKRPRGLIQVNHEQPEDYLKDQDIFKMSISNGRI